MIFLTLKRGEVQVALEHLLARQQESGLNLDDAVKLLGCWDALADPEGILADQKLTSDRHNPTPRGIAITNTTKVSKLVEARWQDVVDIHRAGQDRFRPAGISVAVGSAASMRMARRTHWNDNASWPG